MSADEQTSTPSEVAQGALRGAIAAMAMTGMRTGTESLGLVDEAPPQSIFRQRARFLLWTLPRKRQRAAVEFSHWAFGALGGVVYALLPDSVRQRAWSGPVYGLAVWLGFEFGLAPALRLDEAREMRPVERAAVAADHLLYGLVLSETRRRPRD